MSDFVYTIMIFSSFLIALLYIITYYSSFISNCNKFPENEIISSEECCKNTWSYFWSSVPITLFIILVGVVLSFGMFYWILR